MRTHPLDAFCTRLVARLVACLCSSWSSFLFHMRKRTQRTSILMHARTRAHTQEFALDGAVIVTTPSKLALVDVYKGINMFASLNVSE
jgi:hypothetical protein